MIAGIHQSAVSMTGLEKWQTAISQNIANSQVAGYKSRQVSFSQVADDVANTDNSVFKPSYVHAEESISNKPGQIVNSDNPMDLAIDGKGFFTVEGQNGDEVLTRNGQFRTDANHRLVTLEGMPVLDQGEGITVRSNGGPIHISNYGEVLQDGASIGRITIVDVPDSALQRIDGGFRVNPESGESASEIDNPRVIQGYYEGGNSDPIRSMVDLISVSRQYEVNAKMISSFDTLLGNVNTKLGEV